MRRRWTILGALGLAAAGGIFAWTIAAPRRQQSVTLGDLEARLRAIQLALTVYAQNNQDYYPPPESAAPLLLNSGALSGDVLTARSAAGTPSPFMLIAPQHPESKWSNSFTRTEPLLYTDPAALGGRSLVAFTDGHTELVSGDHLSSFLKEVGWRAVALRLDSPNTGR